MATPKLILLSLTVMASLASAAPAMADSKTKEVRHVDLDLSSAAGRDRLALRIKQAVKQVCETPRGFSIEERQDHKACEKQAQLRAAPETARIIADYMDKRRLAYENTARVGTN